MSNPQYALGKLAQQVMVDEYASTHVKPVAIYVFDFDQYKNETKKDKNGKEIIHKY